MEKLQLTRVESMLVVALNANDSLTAEKLAALRAQVAALEEEIKLVQGREAKLQRESVEGWDKVLREIGRSHGAEIPKTATMSADDSDLVAIEWEDVAGLGVAVDEEPEVEEPEEIEIGSDEAEEWDLALADCASAVNKATV